MIVVAPDVIVPLFIESARTAECEGLYRLSAEWIAPPSWRSGFSRTLGRLVAAQKMKGQNAAARLEGAGRLMEAGERLVAPGEVFSFLATTTISFEEAELLVLAAHCETDLVTYDKKLLKMFPEVAMTPEQIIAR